MIFHSSVQVVGELPAFPPETIRTEVSQPRVPIAEARGAGPIHRLFIDALPAAWQADPEVEIFSRCLYLKAGWYPLTPHWHFDWGQPADGPTVHTLMALFGGNSRTEFVVGPLEHPDEPPADRPRRRGGGTGGGGYAGGGRGRWDAAVEDGLRAGALTTTFLDPQQLILFDNRALHRARPATSDGWRVLVRAIRGLPKRDEERPDRGYGPRGRFTTCRNGFIPETDEERARFAPYRE